MRLLILSLAVMFGALFQLAPDAVAGDSMAVDGRARTLEPPVPVDAGPHGPSGWLDPSSASPSDGRKGSDNRPALDFLSAIGSIGQVVTAILALIIVVKTSRAATKFNEVQSFSLHVQNLNHFNDRMIDLAIANKDMAERVGRKITDDSDILADYMHFLLLNSVHIAFSMHERRLLRDDEVDQFFKNAANFLRRRGETYVNALLKRGYDARFADHFRAEIKKAGGYPQGPGQGI